MIIFKLSCGTGHEFEGWFSDTADYDSQQARGLLTCPVCHNAQVTKQLGGFPMTKTPPKPVAKALAQPAPSANPIHNVDPVVLLKAVNQYVQKNFTNVGNQFYDKAVKMHEGELPPQKIYGEVTKEQQEQLDDQEIPYARLPKLSPQFEN